MSLPLLVSHDEGEQQVLIGTSIVCIYRVARFIVEHYAMNEYPLRKDRK